MLSVAKLLLLSRITRKINFVYNTTDGIDKNIIKVKHPVSLYIHIPFCENLCNYCFFHKFPFDRKKVDIYINALIDELNILSAMDININNIYIGGGTPTIYVDGLYKLIKHIHSLYNIQSLSVETDPHHLTVENIKTLVELKVKRVSIGIQTFQETVIAKSGRLNNISTEYVNENIVLANQYFETVNVDLIFNFPDQSLESLEYDLNNAKKLKTTQLTYYPLMNHNNSFLNDVKGIKKEKKMYFYIIKNLKDMYIMNSVWSFALHKNIYDEYLTESEEFLCAGCGSFGYINNILYANSFNLDKYINQITYEKKLPIKAFKKLNDLEGFLYNLSLKLYTLKVEKRYILDKYNKKTNYFIKPILWYLKTLKIINIDEKYISLTEKGLFYWLNVMKNFYINTNTLREFCKNLNT
jgi:coproporphyrinogen III oxidase-like Fe-S oxidoreductase